MLILPPNNEDMKQPILYPFFLLLFLAILPRASAQIRGVITDSLTQEPLMYVNVQWKGTTFGAHSNEEGEYRLNMRPGADELVFSYVGYVTKTIRVKPSTTTLNGQLDRDNVMLQGLVIKPKKEGDSKKNNPAVDFMRKVIAHKKTFKLEERDYYQYQKYEKLKMSLNDITPEKLEKGIYKKFAFFKDQVEESTLSGKLILPFSVKETVSRTFYRKEPQSEKTVIEGVNSSGIDQFFSMGEDMMGTVLRDVFSDVNIYEDNIRLFQRYFTSPIGRGGIAFYKYYLEDTVMVDNQLCVHLSFVPMNSQDFGFTGHLYVLNDSSYAVKRCTMKLPRNTGVNWVENMDIVQQFEQLPDGNWVLTDDDMVVELGITRGIQGLEVQRTTKYTDYKFDEIEARIFRLKGEVIKEANMLSRSDEYWEHVRQVPLTKKESTMDIFMNRIEQIPGFKYIIFAAKALIENYVETGGQKHPSKVDIGPINTMITSNYLNGTRFRLSAMTTGHLSPHWSVSGYGAYGTRDKKWFYSGQVAYSFNKRSYVLWEFPKHYLAFKYTYDVMNPMDKYLMTDKDNMFVGWKWAKVDQMSYIRDATLTYELERNTGFSMQAIFRHRNDQPGGKLEYWKNDGTTPGQLDGNTRVHDITTSEVGVTLRYAPGETFVNTKQRRIPVSLDAPVFSLSHTTGIKGFLGGDYNFNLTELSMRKRFWFGSWGKLDATLRAGAQWNKVPFPLLNQPMANLSYITQNNESFNLINNMEFLNDRYASLALSYDLNGKLFNRIPLIRKLKWREMFRVRTLWGMVTDKNNPYKSHDPNLFLFPMRDGEFTSYVMDKRKPYVEVSVGIYNIFKLLHIEYVRRLTYTNLPGTTKWGIRFMVLTLF